VASNDEKVIVSHALGISVSPPRGTIEEKRIRRQAEEIIHRELGRLIKGEEVGPGMCDLLRAWLEQRKRGRGRPEEDKKVVVIGAFVDLAIAREPERKLESIYEEIGSQWGLKRRQIISIMAKWKKHPRRGKGVLMWYPKDV
jgi:hypothetical protein